MGEEALSAVCPRAGSISRRRHHKIIVVVVVVAAIFSNVSSGAICCWPGARFGQSQLYEGESVKMVQSGNIT